MTDFSLAQITKAIEDSNTTFLDFKNAVFARMDALETREAKSNRRSGIANLGGSQEVDPSTPGEVKAFSAFVRRGDDRGLQSKAMATTTNGGADGGVAIPKQIDAQIESLMIPFSPIRQYAKVQQVETSDYHRLVNLRGTASGWVGETAARPQTNTPTFADIKIVPADLYANPQVTQTMLDDAAFNTEEFIVEEIAREFARAEGAAFIGGTGNNQPTGILNGTPTAVADDSTRPFGTLQYIPSGVSGAWPATNPADVLIKTLFSLKAGYRAGSAWMFSKSTLQQITTFKDTTGRFIFQPVTAPGVPQMLLGYPIAESEDIPAMAANSISVLFGNFEHGYTIVDRIGTRMVRDPFSNKPFVGFYTVKRVGGALINSEAFKLIKFSVS